MTSPMKMILPLPHFKRRVEYSYNNQIYRYISLVLLNPAFFNRKFAVPKQEYCDSYNQNWHN